MGTYDQHSQAGHKPRLRPNLPLPLNHHYKNSLFQSLSGVMQR